MMSSQEFKGIIRVSPTPLNKGLVKVDELDCIAEEPRRMGVAIEFYLGENGENRFLTHKQRVAVIEHIHELKTPGIKILVGTTGDTLEETI